MTQMFIMLTEGAAGGGSNYSYLILMLLIFVVMWFFMIRPQQKRQKELNNFRNSLQKGMKIITAGGIYGVIKEIKENSVLIEVDGGVTLRVDKSMIMKDNSDQKQVK